MESTGSGVEGGGLWNHQMLVKGGRGREEGKWGIRGMNITNKWCSAEVAYWQWRGGGRTLESPYKRGEGILVGSIRGGIIRGDEYIRGRRS